MLKLAWAWWSIGLLGLSGVTWVCLIPNPPAIPDLPGADKWVHLATFFSLGLWFFQLRPSHQWQVALGLSGYGLLIEVAQQFTPTRMFEWFDWVADSLGVLLGWPLANTWLGRSLLQIEQRLGYS